MDETRRKVRVNYQFYCGYCGVSEEDTGAERRNLGEASELPLIDRLHRAMLFWQEENRPDLVSF